MKFFACSVLAIFCMITPAEAVGVKDLPTSTWPQSINYLIDEGIVQGYPDGNFRPQKNINRAEFTKIVIGSLFDSQAIQREDDSCFSDVQAGEWFAPYVCLAQTEGILEGYPDGRFRPEQNINQAEALKILYEAFYEGVEPADGEWYQKYLDAAEYDGMLYFSVEQNPGDHILTREQMAYFTAWMLDENSQVAEEISLEAFYGDQYETVDFGWEEMSPEDCYEDEYFDDADRACYLLDDGQDFTSDTDIFPSENNHRHAAQRSADYPSNSYVYLINGETIKLERNTVIDNESKAQHDFIWNRFRTLIPAAYRSNFAEYIVYNDPDDDTAAYVAQTDESLQNWQIAININDTFDSQVNLIDSKEFDLTLIHEFAHVMTLNNGQVDPETDELNCRPQFFTGEGCARKSAFINLFFKKFWTQSQLEAAETDPEAFYDKNPERFVTDYAASNPGEDIAETFSYFVARPKPKNCDRSIAEKKLCFLYEFPSLVTLRKNIRTAIE